MSVTMGRMMADGLLQPFGNRRFWERNLGIRGCRERILPSVGNIPVAIPAGLPFAGLRHHVIYLPGLHQRCRELRMAADAVVHDDLRAGILGGGNLRLAEGDECRCMLHSVHPLESIFPDDILMGDMAVIARDSLPTAMGRVIPSGIIGLHDVAVDTGRRIVPNQIGMETHQIKEKAAATDKNARKDQQEYLLPKFIFRE